MSVFIDSSVWFASMVARDRNNSRATAILSDADGYLTSDYVVVETWLLLNSRYGKHGADSFWERIRRGPAKVEFITPADLEAAWAIGEIFADQAFSIVDKTSFAVMERLGLRRAASFDHDFAIYRYGRGRDRAFEILR